MADKWEACFDQQRINSNIGANGAWGQQGCSSVEADRSDERRWGGLEDGIVEYQVPAGDGVQSIGAILLAYKKAALLPSKSRC